VASGNLSNATAIGSLAIVQASNTIQLGNAAITDVKTSGTVTAAAYVTTSDARLKTNIQAIEAGLSTVLQLQPYSYEKKRNLGEAFTYDTKEMGFLAQDMQQLLPELVKEGSDDQKTLSVNYVALIPLLTRAIQEQQQQIEALQEQLSHKNNKKKRRNK
jgi:hypothetical protein